MRVDTLVLFALLTRALNPYCTLICLETCLVHCKGVFELHCCSDIALGHCFGYMRTAERAEEMYKSLCDMMPVSANINRDSTFHSVTSLNNSVCGTLSLQRSALESVSKGKGSQPGCSTVQRLCVIRHLSVICIHHIDLVTLSMQQVVEAVLLKTIQSVFILNSCWRRWKGSDERPQMKEHSVLNAKMELRCLHDAKVNILQKSCTDDATKTVSLRWTVGSLSKSLLLPGLSVLVALTSAVYLCKGPLISRTAFSTLHTLRLWFLHTVYITQQPCSYTLLKKTVGSTFILSITYVPGKKVVVFMAFTTTLQNRNIMKWQHPCQRLSVLTYIHCPINIMLLIMTHSFLLTNTKGFVGKVTLECDLSLAVANWAWLRYVGTVALCVLLAGLTTHILFTVANCFYLKLFVYMLMTPVTAVLQIVRASRKYAVIIKIV